MNLERDPGVHRVRSSDPPYLKHAGTTPGTVLQAETPGQPLYFKSVFIYSNVAGVLFMLFYL